MVDSYTTDTNQVKTSAENIHEVGKAAYSIQGVFDDGVRGSDGWWGTSDSFARSVGPRTTEETGTTASTVLTLMTAVVRIADGTHANATSITDTQALNTEAINASDVYTGGTTGTGDSDATSGRH
ncbi:hypothetical protein ACIPSE_13565 [Streptomyces sp. NPDC090106]|uniref:hypothetical protein n=1 Tax=Streptomyces sp. NPDC090106 TaxID=3365946 RepID=UPI0038037ED9